MTRVRRTVVVAASVVAVIGAGTLAWWLGSDPRRGVEAVGTTEVLVADDAFGPSVVEVAVGDTVTWTFADDVAHDVSGDGFESALMTEGTFAATFDEPGTYDYVCTIHPISMRGRVVVVAGETAFQTE